MRVQAGLLGIVVAGFAAWLLFALRDGTPDLVRERDRLVASDAVVAVFDPSGVAGYRFVSIRGVGWLWERTTASGEPYPDAIVYNGTQHFLRIAEGCYVAPTGIRPPLIPGLTTSQRLARQGGLIKRDGGTYVYSVLAEFAASPDGPQDLPRLDVTEDLTSLHGEHTIHASTGAFPDYIWRGDYTIRRASPEEAARAKETIEAAHASDYAEMVVRQRVVGTIVGSVLQEPSSIVIAEECPESPANLWSAAGGGQVEGLRSTRTVFSISTGDQPAFVNAVATTLSIRAPVQFLNEVFEAASYGDVPVRTASTVIINRGRAGGLALFVLSSTSRPWFRC
ncbi:MAG TPA: hypothetical protein VFY90_07965 [Tepidiformaceae bacterium]|nr:hypothetical protein [Tepidiformaceae bacterium]